MGAIKRAGWYTALFSFVLYGGCDHILVKYLKPEYSSRAVRMRQKVANIVDGGMANAVDSAEETLSELEKSVGEVEKNDKPGE